MALITLEEFKGVKAIKLESFSGKVSTFKNLYTNKLIDFVSVQDSISIIKKRFTIKGLHFQSKPHEQSKLISVINGSIQDYIVDLRRESSTFLDYGTINLTSENNLALLLPKGFAHGYMTLEKNTCIFYKLDHPYEPRYEKTLIWNDQTVNIGWLKKNFTISDKDNNGKKIEDLLRIL